MQNNIIAIIIGSMLSSTLFVEILKNFFNKRQKSLEEKQKELANEHLIISTYDKIVEGLRKEVDRLKEDIEDLRRREATYNENQNLWIKNNMELQRRIDHLQQINKAQSEEIIKLKSKL